MAALPPALCGKALPFRPMPLNTPRGYASRSARRSLAKERDAHDGKAQPFRIARAAEPLKKCLEIL